MLKARKSIIVIIAALFVFACLGMAQAAFYGQEIGNIDGLVSGNYVPPVAGAIGPVHNYVNPGGLGQVLLNQYYNARNGYVTYFTIVNTASQGQRVRLRFREGANVMPNGVCTPEEPRGSFELLDFDICLSKYDMWSGYIMQNGSGGAMLCNFNDTDTKTWGGNASAPGQNFAQMAASIAGSVTLDATHACIPFRYGSNGLANGNISADATLEGYFEVIGENELSDNGLPPGQDIQSCNPMQTAPTPAAPDQACNTGSAGPCETPDNALFGNVIVVNGPNAGTYAYDSTAIADFTALPIWQNIAQGTVKPDLASGTDGVNGVNYILTKQHLFSMYDLQDVPTKTEYSITFPTKSLTQICGATNDIFDDTTVLFTSWDDQENSKITTCSVSPCPPGTTNSLPYEENVIQLNTSTHNSDFLATNLIATGNAIASPYQFGWFDVDLTSQSPSTCSLTGTGTGITSVCHEVCTTNLVNANDTSSEYCSDGWPALGLSYVDIGNGFWTGAMPMQYSTDAPCGQDSSNNTCD